MSHKVKKIILRCSPPFVQKSLRDLYFAVKLLPCSIYDYRRFLTHAGLNKNRDAQIEHAARITLLYHQVEKGLSLAEPRAGFGLTVIPELLQDTDAYFTAYGLAEPATTAVAALLAYLDYHQTINHPVPHVHDGLFAVLEKHHIALEQARTWQGGVIHSSRAALETERNAGFKRFFASRHSMRQFAKGSVAEADIRSAVALAQHSPSVCNRQSWRVHAFSEPEKMARLLKIQSGSQGFGDQAALVLLISCELGSFLDVEERYQPWIDGGMFAMSLSLALHDLGYGSCCLNWSKTSKTDKAMREATGIPASEQIIMLMAVGVVKDEFRVARSYRPAVEHCLTIHNA